jgi:hypothetical protein
MKRDLDRLIKEAQQRGWKVDGGGARHWRLKHPNGALIYCPASPSDWRGVRNFKADLKRAERREQR